ncbi:MAG: membrane protein insertion efficiency factor YidD [Actinomycetes bacterium]
MNSLARSLAISPLRFYQKFISPGLAPRCKYYPSCSSYAITAISTHGLRGVGMALWRLLRCNPWSSGGVDYVISMKAQESTLMREGAYGLRS